MTLFSSSIQGSHMFVFCFLLLLQILVASIKYQFWSFHGVHNSMPKLASILINNWLRSTWLLQEILFVRLNHQFGSFHGLHTFYAKVGISAHPELPLEPMMILSRVAPAENFCASQTPIWKLPWGGFRIQASVPRENCVEQEHVCYFQKSLIWCEDVGALWIALCIY